MTTEPKPLRGSDDLARRAVQIAVKRGYVTAGFAGCEALLAAKDRGWIRRDRRFCGEARFRSTPEGRDALRGYSIGGRRPLP